ncbi:hypothetical protein QKU48_gp0643 [Fadolivirus algeromassiliense]|uniref:Uncharacterized protein n=1 Tax=Fadolivirus FV1/VV64 TaxID=3070911 RepID=A0A7D3R105_9VIRU|nr:hypothetical protein QKU48_gp0643 [Fadolivirus algeromassiliense]QKF94101.1 hypothetical protein Fadolivirus_1_643 [Fadolivirus FV1/VV64]
MIKKKSILYFIEIKSDYYTFIEENNKYLVYLMTIYGNQISTLKSDFDYIENNILNRFPHIDSKKYLYFEFSNEMLNDIIHKSNILEFYDVVICGNENSMKYTLESNILHVKEYSLNRSESYLNININKINNINNDTDYDLYDIGISEEEPIRICISI